MWNARALSFLLAVWLCLGSVMAQTVTDTTAAAPEPTTPGTSASQPDSPQPTDTATGGQSTPLSSGSGTTSPSTSKPSGTGGGGGSSSPTSTNSPQGPPDVLLRVPELHVGKIQLDVDNLRAEVNLAADIANLVSINAGVQVGIEKVNITIADVNAELELKIRLGHLVDIVNRTLATLDLNPLLINILDEVADLVDTVIGAVDGLLGSIVNGNTKLNFLIDNLGNIVQEVVGEAGDVVSSIVGNFDKNMTYTGQQKVLDNGLIQKTYSYSPLGSLVNIIFNALGQVVQATVVKGGSGGGGSGGGGGSSSTQTGTTAPTSAPTTAS